MPDYLPFLKGLYSTAPGLQQISKAENATDKQVFQIDETYGHYLANKTTGRLEDLQKYVRTHNLNDETAVTVNRFIVSQLLIDQPEIFRLTGQNDQFTLTNKIKPETLQWGNDWLNIHNSGYISLFDALCSQVQEDLVICQLDDTSDWLAALHLCSPNHWAAGDKIGKPFDVVHEPVPGMEKMMPHYRTMLESIVTKGPFTRFAWGIATDNRLNHHPVAPAGTDQETWNGRTFEDASDLYIRVERQNLIGFPTADAFLFTIRTYFYAADALTTNEKKLLIAAVASMSPESMRYKGLEGKLELLKEKLLNGYEY